MCSESNEYVCINIRSWYIISVGIVSGRIKVDMILAKQRQFTSALYLSPSRSRSAWLLMRPLL